MDRLMPILEAVRRGMANERILRLLDEHGIPYRIQGRVPSGRR